MAFPKKSGLPVVGKKLPVKVGGFPGQSPSGLPEKVTKPKAAKPHPVAASLFRGLVRPGGSKIGDPFRLGRNRGQPLPFHAATGIGPWQRPAFGPTPNFGPRSGFGGGGGMGGY
jgi:hypothetical protein